MTYLFLSIICSVYLILIFKQFGKMNVDTFQTIVINYAICVLFGLFFLKEPITIKLIYKTWLSYSLILGLLFISTFNLIGYAVKKVGVSATVTANKLSLIIPVLIAFLFYGDSINSLKLIGIFVALFAVYFVSKRSNHHEKLSKWLLIAIIIFVFIGSGIVDALIKHVELNFMKPEEYNLFLICSFATAAFIGIILIIIRHLYFKVRFKTKNIFTGLALGIPNYAALYYLIKTLNLPGFESSVIFPINNIAIVLGSTLGGYFLFKEHLSRINWLGVLLAIISILLIAFAQ